MNFFCVNSVNNVIFIDVVNTNLTTDAFLVISEIVKSVRTEIAAFAEYLRAAIMKISKLVKLISNAFDARLSVNRLSLLTRDAAMSFLSEKTFLRAFCMIERSTKTLTDS